MSDHSEDLDVEVCLPRDHVGPVGGLDDIVPMGTWVPGCIRRSDWRDGIDGPWQAVVRYSVTHRGTVFNYLAAFDQDHIRLVRDKPSASHPGA